jgi:hypothetical protein
MNVKKVFMWGLGGCMVALVVSAGVLAWGLWTVVMSG